MQKEDSYYPWLGVQDLWEGRRNIPDHGHVVDRIMRREYRVVSVTDQRQVELIRNLVTLEVFKYVVSCPAGIFNINLMV